MNRDGFACSDHAASAGAHSHAISWNRDWSSTQSAGGASERVVGERLLLTGDDAPTRAAARTRLWGVPGGCTRVCPDETAHGLLQRPGVALSVQLKA